MFAERLLRAAGLRVTNGGVSLATALSSLGTQASVLGTDGALLRRGGTPYLSTYAAVRAYALGISAGTATIPENVVVSGTLGVTGATTLQSTVQTTGDVSVGLTAGTSRNLNIQAAVGNDRSIYWRTGSSPRWRIYATNQAESGSNAGSNLWFQAFDDAGTLIDNWLQITRAAAGTVTLARPFSNTANSSLAQVASGNASVTVGTGTTAGGAFLNIRASATQYAQLQFQRGSLARWSWYLDNTAEPGSDAGGQLSLAAHTDAGAFIDNVIRINRPAGETIAFSSARPVTMGRLAVGGASGSTSTALITPAGTTGVSSLRVPHGVAPTAPVNGDVWTTTTAFAARLNGATASFSGVNTGDQTITLTGDVTGSGTGSFAATIANDAVTYAKMQNVSAASRLLGRGDSGSGDVQEITLGSGLTMTGTTLSASGGGSGDVVGPASATDNAIVRFDGTTGKLVQNSGVIVSDSNNVTGISDLTASGNLTAGSSQFVTGGTFVSNTGVYRIDSSTGSVVIRAGTSAFSATDLTLYGSSHATRANDAVLSVQGYGEVLTWDDANGNFYLGNSVFVGAENVAIAAPRGTNFQGMQRGIYIRAGQAPTGDPTSGGFLWVDNATGDLKFRGLSGTITTIALA